MLRDFLENKGEENQKHLEQSSALRLNFFSKSARTWGRIPRSSTTRRGLAPRLFQGGSRQVAAFQQQPDRFLQALIRKLCPRRGTGRDSEPTRVYQRPCLASGSEAIRPEGPQSPFCPTSLRGLLYDTKATKRLVGDCGMGSWCLCVYMSRSVCFCAHPNQCSQVLARTWLSMGLIGTNL